MSEYVWLALYTIIELMGYWSVYIFIFRAGINKQWWRYPIYVMMVLLVQLGLYYLLNDISFFNLFTVILGVVIPFALIEKRSMIMKFMYLIVIFVTPMIASVMNMFLYGAVGNEVLNIESFSIWRLVSMGSVVIFCLIAGFVLRITNNTFTKLRFNKVQYITLLIGIVCCAMIIVCNELYVLQGTLTKLGEFLLATAGVLICVVLLVTSVIQGILLSKNAQYKEEQLRYDYFLKTQEQNINALINRDKELRQFRHDIYGHMTAIRAIALKSENKELEEYVDNMVKDSAIFDVKRYTGNVAVDAIISDMHNEMESKKINFKYECDIYIPEYVSVYDMCTIMYNILKNAIEACEKIDYDERNIVMKLFNIGEKICINVCNSCDVKGETNDISDLVTAKYDKKNHGIGIQNIKEAVNRNGGVIEFLIKDYIFTINIVI